MKTLWTEINSGLTDEQRKALNQWKAQVMEASIRNVESFNTMTVNIPAASRSARNLHRLLSNVPMLSR
jgi:hypothetical protein